MMNKSRERELLEQVDAPAEGRFAEINGMYMYYEIHGEPVDGRCPLFCLHGFSATGEVWKDRLPPFTEHFQVILPDLRGHGRSTNPSGEFTHRQSANDILALADHLGLDRFMAMGSSTGGMTLLHAATSQPQRLEALVLVAATIYFPEPARRIMLDSDPALLTPEDIANMRRAHRWSNDQVRDLQRQFFRFKDSYDDMNFTPPYLSTITARTLIIHGDRDQFFPVNIPYEMYQAIPNSYLWILPNANHGPIARDPEGFSRHTVDFLFGNWEST